MARTIDFTPEAISAVLLFDGWHRCSSFQIVNMTGGPGWADAFALQAPDEPVEARSVTGPLSSILAFRSKQMESADDRAMREAEIEQETLALFNWQHYCSPETYDAAATKQNDLCPDCGSLLDDMPITHFLASRDVVLCSNCSPLKPRYGRP